ncbi:MAG: alpha/beta fold hydrolase [Sandaracinaceae bacterium]
MGLAPYELAASDGPTLAAYRWLPDGPPRGAVQIVHGMAEHAQRYDRLARALTEAGWAVASHDHRGHGHTAMRDEDLGFFAERGGWARVLDDVRTVRGWLRAEAPEGPLALLGHSMGSFIAISSMLEEDPGVERVALTGSGQLGGALATAALWVARLERVRQGPRGRSALIEKLTFGSYNDRFAPARTAFDWLSRDEAEVDRYVDDPRCGFRCTNQLWIDLLEALRDLGRPAVLRGLPASVPFGLFSGALDPVGDASKGIRRLAAQLRQAGVKEVEVKLYPEARHEVLNETNRDEVTRDLLAWFEGERGG